MSTKLVSKDLVRREKLLSKLLSRVAAELGRLRINVTSDLIDEARACLLEKWSQHGGSLSDKDIRSIVKSLKSSQRSQTAMETRMELPDIVPVNRATTPIVQAAPSASSDAKALLLQTTKKQRLMMADREWIAAAEKDRADGAEQKKYEKLHHLEVMREQKEILDRQMEERNRQKEEERQEKLRRQREMEELIANSRQMDRQEHLNALTKAQKEREFREKQQREIELERERQRIEEHNEQVRMVLLNQEELRRQRESELARKQQGKEEWKKTVEDNQKKLQEKETEKERIREIDREYQKKYVESQEKQEREREEAKRRKEARATYFQKLGNGVAELFMAKEQDQSAKIDAEFQRQLQRSLEDERNRQQRTKMRLQDCLSVQQQQISEKKRREEAEKEESRRYASMLRKQAQETIAAEEAKKNAMRQDAIRTKEFLSTQLQLAHFKETKPLETSIARPPSRSTTMFSPSRQSSVPPTHSPSI